MLFVVVLLICIAGARAVGYEEDDDDKCIVPPFPNHGTYKIIEPTSPSKPGEEVPSYVIEFTCEDGYVQTYNETYTCLGGAKSDEEPPECLPLCKSPSPGVLSCGAGVSGEEAKCLAPNNIAAVSRVLKKGLKITCGLVIPEVEKIIAGGKPAKEAELPWHAGVYTKTTTPYKQICGGSLVSNNVVISAAHCFWSEVEKQQPASKYAVAVGKIYRPWNDPNDEYAQKSEISSIKIPPRYQGATASLQDDIAVLFLSSEIQFNEKVRPVCLDFDVQLEEQQMMHGNLGKVAGWGLTSEDGKESPVLKTVEMPVVDIEECIANSDPTFIRHITSDKICAGYNNGTSVCKGDSGGGLSFPDMGAMGLQYYLRGIVSAAPRNDHLCNTVTWATFTRVQNHQRFIQQKTVMYSYKSKQKCATGAALTRPVMELGEEFCLETSMHGFRHIAVAKRHWFERMLWVTATGLAVWGAVYISLGQLQRYNESPTVVTLEKNFRSWNYSLPAITACVKDRVDASKLPKVIKDTWNVDSTDESYEYYSRFVHTVANSDLLHLENYQEFINDEKLNVDMYKLAVGVFKLPDVKTTTSSRVVPKWIPVMTEAGVCFSINSLAIEDVAIIPPNPNDTALLPITCKYGEVFCQILLEIKGSTNFYFHSAYDILDITTTPAVVHAGIKRMFEVSVTETGCGRGVYSLSVERRACRFIDEPEVGGRKVYSTNSCRLSCRSKKAMQLCGCRPFYYFYEGGAMCNASGMACLATYAQQLASIEGLSCSCDAQCLYSMYTSVSSLEYVWQEGPFSGEGSCRYSVLPPKVRYTREIVFHFQDLVVSFGGAAGLFLGASFISFVEIFYFILEKILRAISIKNDNISSEVDQSQKISSSFEEQRIKELTTILEQNRFNQDYNMRNNYYF